MPKPKHQEALAALLEQVRVKLEWETLETRRSDSLDCHDISVSLLTEIVRLAFNAGIDHATQAH